MTSKSPPDPELTERLRSLVGRLVVDLGIGEGRGAEGLATASVAMLGKMISPYDVTKVATTQTQRLLTERAPDPEAFKRAYESLKGTGAGEVDKFLAVVAKIAADPHVLAAVTRRPGETFETTMGGGESFPTTAGSSGGGASDAAMDHDDEDDVDVPSPTVNLEMSQRAESAGRSVETTHLPMEHFSFNTNPLASDDATGTPGPDTPGASVGMRTMTQRQDGLGGETMDPDFRERMRTLDLTSPAPPAPSTPSVAANIRAQISGERPPLKEGVDFPALPNWMSTRPYLTGAHLGGFESTNRSQSAATDPAAGKPLDMYTTACQELLVLDDLLYAMLGAEGRYVKARRVDAVTGEPVAAPLSSAGDYIKAESSTRKSALAGTAVRFTVEPGLEGSLAALVDGMLPLCSAAAAVADYVESRQRFEGGLNRARARRGDARAPPGLADDGGAARAPAQRRPLIVAERVVLRAAGGWGDVAAREGGEARAEPPRRVALE